MLGVPPAPAGWMARRTQKIDVNAVAALVALALLWVYLNGHGRSKHGDVQVRQLSSSLPGQDVQTTAGDAVEQAARVKVTAFIGVMTGFTTNHKDPKYNYENRRTALRQTWFPASQQEADRLETEGVVIRFVVGHAKDELAEAAMQAEQRANGCFLRLPIMEHYGGLPHKVVTFMRLVLAAYSFDYLFKIDDDVYMRVDRVVPAVQQWQSEQADYVGCMKQGAVFKDKSLRWFEPQHALLGDKYFTHTWGSAYVVSSGAVQAIVAVPPGRLRFFDNEDVTIGSWMLAFNVTHRDDRRMCEGSCSGTSIVVYDYPDCAGLCNPSQQLLDLHTSAACRLPAVGEQGGRVPDKPRAFWFAPVPRLV